VIAAMLAEPGRTPIAEPAQHAGAEREMRDPGL